MKKVKVDYEKRKIDPNNPSPISSDEVESPIKRTLMFLFYALLGIIQALHL